MDLEEALLKLDPKNDDHWTEGGAPRVDVLKEMTENSGLTRQAISDAAPHFTRENPTLEATDPDAKDDETSSDSPAEGAGDNGDPDLPTAEEEAAHDEEIELADAENLTIWDAEDPAKFYNRLMAMDIKEAEEAATFSSNAAQELLKQRAALDKAIKTHHQNMANAKNRVAALTPKNKAQQDIMDHIRKQRELRAAKMGGISAIKSALGIDKNVKLDGRAPIDQAFDRKRERGTQRPTRG